MYKNIVDTGNVCSRKKPKNCELCGYLANVFWAFKNSSCYFRVYIDDEINIRQLGEWRGG